MGMTELIVALSANAVAIFGLLYEQVRTRQRAESTNTQLHSNGGGSVYDKVEQIRDTVNDIDKRLTVVETRQLVLLLPRQIERQDNAGADL